MRGGKRVQSSSRALAAVLTLLACLPAFASGPRYVTGPPFFPGYQSLPIGWKQPLVRYSTDPGNLSASVNHQAADALVASAMAVWNVPVANVTLAQGGALAEHVSGTNVYLDSSGLVWPADVMSSNAAAIPIAIVYDSDGSVTDTLLGAGASAPSSCRTNAVTEDVDAFDPAGYILHAIIVLNGRCTGAAAAQQIEMQYKLERVFGRVLGLGWSQTNDNVFTGLPVATYNQALHWPILHPIDILCGPYSYQCLPSPFTLRPDDLASLVMVYPVAQNATPAAGKQVSLQAGNGMTGFVTFPDGQGMAGVNVLAEREGPSAVTDTWFEASAVTGSQFRRAAVSPFVAPAADALSSMGTVSQDFPGLYSIAYLPLYPGTGFDNLIASIEPVNALYTGSYSLGPYTPGVVAPSGTTPAAERMLVVSAGSVEPFNFAIADAAAACGTGTDGTSAAPAEISPSGWWNATLCGYGHASYFGVDVRAGRSFTIEATALDAQGLATTTKAMPVLGLFQPSDGVGSLPSLGVTPTAFQGSTLGTTTVAATLAGALRVTLGVADQRGDGRPDFAYQGRMFYADNIEPARVPAAGGTVTITGMGFRAGNSVLVNGVAATATQWTANTIVATVPAMSAARAAVGVAVDVKVVDRGTGASSTMSSALIYDNSGTLGKAMILLSAPAGTLPVGTAAVVPFAVRVVAADGVTPIAGDPIIFSTTTGTALFGVCGGATCRVNTDSTGLASTSVTPGSVGTITLQAADGTVLQTANLNGQAASKSMAVLLAPTGSFPVGTPIATPLVVRVYGPDGSTGLPAHLVTFSFLSGNAVYNACNAPTCDVTTDSTGAAVVWVTPTAGGWVTMLATDGAVSAQASFTAVADVDSMKLIAVPSSPVAVNTSAGSLTVRLLHGDGVTADSGERVTFSAPPQVTIASCASSSCQLSTDALGNAGSTVTATRPGTYTVTASYGALSQSATFTAAVQTRSLRVVSAPPGNLLVGSASTVSFAVQLLDYDGVTPLPGYPLNLQGPEDSVWLALCNDGTCVAVTDANGMVSTSVTPLKAGVIPLTATYAPLNASASITAVTATDTLLVVEQPGSAGVFVADTVPLELVLLQPDGISPDAGKNVTLTVTHGPFTLSGCGSGGCVVATSAQGLAIFSGLATAPGTVTLTATYGKVQQAISFTVAARADVLNLVSAPASGSYTGAVATAPFAVQALAAGILTPAAGRSVTVQVTNGAAGLTACGGTTVCVLVTDAAGMVSSAVTPTAAGQITLKATDGTATQSATFSAVDPPDLLTLVSVPANNAWAGTATATAFSVRLTKADGITGDPGKAVVLSSSNGVLTVCGAASCTLLTDANGLAASSVTPAAAGTVTLQAMSGTLSLAAAFTAVVRADLLKLVSSPANGGLAGAANLSAFAVQLLLADGFTPAGGRAVQFSVTAGRASLGACAASACTLLTDSNGLATSPVTPQTAGAITLQAVEANTAANVIQVTFTALPQPDRILLTSSPGTTVAPGALAASAFAVRLVQADGVTPVSGVGVTFSATSPGSGGVQFGACAQASCTVLTDAQGFASTSVTGTSAGALTLLATADASTGAGSVSVPFEVMVDAESLHALEALTYIAEGALFGRQVQVSATRNGAPAAGETVAWSGPPGAVIVASETVTDATGRAAAQVEFGPLAAGAIASVSACAWSNVCAQSQAIGVAQSAFVLAVVGGGSQAASGGAPLGTVSAQVTDGGANPVAGAAVTIYQTVTAQSQVCVGESRCPAQPVLASQVTVVASDVAGTVAVVPLVVPGVATRTELYFSAGTQAFATVVLTSTP